MIIQTIQMFMGMCLLLSIVVGVLSVPILSDNTNKSNQIAGLKTKNRISEHLIHADSGILALVTNMSKDSLSSNDIREAKDETIKNLVAVADEIVQANPENKNAITEINRSKSAISRDFEIIASKNQNQDTVNAALLRIQVNKSKVRAVALSPLEP